MFYYPSRIDSQANFRLGNEEKFAIVVLVSE